MGIFAAPRYLLRKNLVLSMLRMQGKFLEIGTGGGDFTSTLAKKGYHGKAIDLNMNSVEITKAKLGKNSNVKVEMRDFRSIDEKFSTVFMFEVLEHISDDLSALKTIHNLIEPNGLLVLSVPAKNNLWGPMDDLAGHIRRYEKSDLKEKLRNARFRIIGIYSYGFPVANIIKPIRDWLAKKELKMKAGKTTEEKTIESGLHESQINPQNPLVNDITLQPFYFLQRAFLNTDLGTGYVAFARKIMD
ncbi:class I SAM-dependent methyltransferase [Candidatus Woesearchaeota archaeon]|nr:class I SAM-dependent methyltransferase [Candidatus Woesearchaeota archaeon]